MEPQTSLKLSDELIGQIAKVVQLALLTGTNVVDHLRLFRAEVGDGKALVLTPEYKEYFEASIKKMLAEVEDIKEEMRGTEAQA